MKKLLYILFLVFSTVSLHAVEYGDSAIYQGVHVKLDLGNAVLRLAKSHGSTQQYEALVSVNLKKMFYPTMELGYGWSSDEVAGGAYKGQGGFTRIGMDLNPLKKSRNNDYALLIGARLGIGVQNYTLSNLTINDDYWTPGGTFITTDPMWRADCWGEIVANVQVKVAGPFFMGWAARAHFLFTKKANPYLPYFIPGLGYPDGPIFGFNYYVGFRF